MSNKPIINIILICAIIALSVGIVSADSSPPGVPVILKGTVNIDGNPAPAGTSITAKVGGNEAGATSVLTAGSYGDTANGRLPVSASSNGAVDFYVNGIKATPSPAFTYNSTDAGKIFVVNLNAPSSTAGGRSGTSGSSSGTGTDGGITGKPTATKQAGTPIKSLQETPTGTSPSTVTTTAAVPQEFNVSLLLGVFGILVLAVIAIVVLKKWGKI